MNTLDVNFVHQPSLLPNKLHRRKTLFYNIFFQLPFVFFKRKILKINPKYSELISLLCHTITFFQTKNKKALTNKSLTFSSSEVTLLQILKSIGVVTAANHSQQECRICLRSKEKHQNEIIFQYLLLYLLLENFNLRFVYMGSF